MHERPFTHAEYRNILRVAHPDNSASPELRQAVFVLLQQREAIAAQPKPQPMRGSRLPTTLADMLARRDAVSAAKAAKRAANKAAKRAATQLTQPVSISAYAR
jgi:hypothetical protein